MAITRNTFSQARNWFRIRFHGGDGRPIIDSEFNELQDRQDLERQKIFEAQYGPFAIGGMQFIPNNGSSNWTVTQGSFYAFGHVQNFAANFTLPKGADGDNVTRMYCEIVVYNLAREQEPVLLAHPNPLDTRRVAEREEWVFSIKSNNPDNDPLPAGASYRVSIILFHYNWNNGDWYWDPAVKQMFQPGDKERFDAHIGARNTAHGLADSSNDGFMSKGHYTELVTRGTQWKAQILYNVFSLDRPWTHASVGGTNAPVAGGAGTSDVWKFINIQPGAKRVMTIPGYGGNAQINAQDIYGDNGTVASQQHYPILVFAKVKVIGNNSYFPTSPATTAEFRYYTSRVNGQSINGTSYPGNNYAPRVYHAEITDANKNANAKDIVWSFSNDYTDADPANGRQDMEQQLILEVGKSYHIAILYPWGHFPRIAGGALIADNVALSGQLVNLPYWTLSINSDKNFLVEYPEHGDLFMLRLQS